MANNNQQDQREQELRDKMAREAEKEQQRLEEAMRRLEEKFSKDKK